MDLYFAKQYGEIYETIEKGECIEYNYQSEWGNVRYCFIKRPIVMCEERTDYYDIITPYGYGGPIAIEVNNKENLWKSFYSVFEKYCVDNNIVSEFVRFHLYDNSDAREYFYGNVTYVSDNVVCYTESSEDEIWRKYENKVRKNVKKAISYGLTVFSETTDDHLDEFIKIYYETMKRNNAEQFYYFDRSFFLKLMNKLNGAYRFFYVAYNNQIISTELVLVGEEYCYSFLGGTFEQYYNMRPNDYLKHSIISWCVDNGKKAFVLGGGYHKDDGIFRYKKAFAPDEQSIKPFYIGKKIHNRQVYDELVQKHRMENNDIVNSSFFPQYRAK